MTLIPLGSTSSALAKLSKATSSGSLSKQQGEKKETPQERLKRIMNKQLNKQSIIFLMLILEAKHSIHYHRVAFVKNRKRNRNFPLNLLSAGCLAAWLTISNVAPLFLQLKKTQQLKWLRNENKSGRNLKN